MELSADCHAPSSDCVLFSSRLRLSAAHFFFTRGNTQQNSSSFVMKKQEQTGRTERRMNLFSSSAPLQEYQMFLPVHLLEEYKLTLDHFKGDYWLQTKCQEEEEDAVYVILVFLSSCADWSVATSPNSSSLSSEAMIIVIVGKWLDRKITDKLWTLDVGLLETLI